METPEYCMDIFDMATIHGPLHEPMSKFIFKQIFDAVYDMYSEHGLLHRDIKDKNVIVNMKTGQVKIVDFGTPTNNEKATSFSLGSILHILLTRETYQESSFCRTYHIARISKGLSKELYQLIKSCLDWISSRRPTLEQIKSHPWLNCEVELYTTPTFEEALLDMNSVPR